MTDSHHPDDLDEFIAEQMRDPEFAAAYRAEIIRAAQRRRPRRWVDALLVWVALFGMWPIADPGHDPTPTAAGFLDWALHLAAWATLAHRWTIVRRRP